MSDDKIKMLDESELEAINQVAPTPTPKPRPSIDEDDLNDSLDPEDDPDGSIARETDFDKGYYWNKKELYPYTSGRAALFYKLRRANDSPKLEECADDPASFLSDAFILLYLCSHTPDDWRRHRRNSALFLEEIEKWADEHVTNEQHATALEVGIALINSGESNQAEPLPDGTTTNDDELGNEHGRSGRRNT